MKKHAVDTVWEAYRQARREQSAELLSTHPFATSPLLAGFWLVGDSAELSALTVRALLLWAAEKTRPSEAFDWHVRRWRTFCILQHYYLGGASAALLADRFDIEEVTFWVSARKAIERVAPLVLAAEAGDSAEQQAVAAKLRYAACDDAGRQMLRLLAMVDEPLSSAEIATYFPELTHAVFPSLLRLNAIQSSEKGYRIHAALTEFVCGETRSAETNPWHVAASQRAIDLNQPLVACQHLLAAGAQTRAAKLLVAEQQHILSESDTVRLLLGQFERAALPNQTWIDVCLLSGRLAERTEHLRAAQKSYLKAVAAVDPFQKATAYFRLAQLARRTDIDAATHHFKRCIETLAKLSTQAAQLLLAQATLKRAMLFMQERVDLARAKHDLETAQAILQHHSDNSLESELHNRWALYHHKKGDAAAEEPHRWRAWQLAHEGEDAEQIVDATHNLGLVYARLGRYERAISHLEDAHQLALDESLQQPAGLCQQSLGACYFWLGNYDDAHVHYEKAYQLCKTMGLSRWQALICYDLAEVLLVLGKSGEARLYFLEGQALGDELGLTHLAELFEKLAREWGELSAELTAHQHAILTYVRVHGSISRVECQQLIERKPRQATRILNELVVLGLLVRQGSARATCYRLITSA